MSLHHPVEYKNGILITDPPPAVGLPADMIDGNFKRLTDRDDDLAQQITQISSGLANVVQYQASFTFAAWVDDGQEHYYIDFPHNLNTPALIPSIWETDTTTNVLCYCTVEILDANTVRVSCAKRPDNRFAGRVVLMGLLVAPLNLYRLTEDDLRGMTEDELRSMTP